MNDKHNVLPLALVGTGVVIFSIGDVIFKILTSLGIFWWDFLVFGVPFEILVILLIVLLLFGAKKLPELAKGLGKGINEFKKASTDIKKEVENAVNTEDKK